MFYGQKDGADHEYDMLEAVSASFIIVLDQ